MRLLLDSNALFRWFEGSPLLSPAATAAISNPNNDLVVSVASVWEIAIKHALGRIEARELLERMPKLLEEQRITELAISYAHALRAAFLPPHHKDPFDRMLAAQAQAENLRIVSNDRVFDFYGVRRIW